MYIKSINSIIMHKNIFIWFIIFMLTLMLIIIVQIILIPVAFPFWNDGYGLLVESDASTFHSTAVELSIIINDEGWHMWELYPKGWFPAGIAAAVYALTWPFAWAMAPINAAVHATTAIFIYKLLLLLEHNKKITLMAALLFSFMPSAMLWYTQIHKDGYVILGTILYLYGTTLIVRLENINENRLGFLKEIEGLVVAIIGVIFLFLARPFFVEIFMYAGLLTMMGIIAYYLFLFKNSSKKVFLLKTISIVILILVTFFLSMQNRVYNNYSYPETMNNSLQIIDEMSSNDNTTMIDDKSFTYEWGKSAWLPSRIDNRLYSIAIMRSVLFPMSYPDAKSRIDYNKEFHKASDYIFYLPRAIQIAYLAPFPKEWIGQGSYAQTTVFRRLAAFEMIIIYIMLISLLYGFIIWRKKIELYYWIVFCTLTMLPIVYAVPNIGSLYRYRYGFLMVIVSLGFIAFSNILIKIIRKKNSNEHINRY